MTPEKRREHAAYMKLWRKRRRRAAIVQLGGRCVDCGSKRRLEFDHVDPATKAIPSNRLMTASTEAFWAEIDKCVLRCRKCHRIKTLAEGDHTHYHARALQPVVVKTIAGMRTRAGLSLDEALRRARGLD